MVNVAKIRVTYDRTILSQPFTMNIMQKCTLQANHHVYSQHVYHLQSTYLLFKTGERE